MTLNIQQAGGSSAAATEAQLAQIRSDLGVSRTTRSFTRAEFDAEVAAERARIVASGSGRYLDAQRLGVIIGEEGTRVWSLATGGTNAANAAASHAKTVILSAAKTVVLAADAGVMRSTSGVPASGVGADGDQAIDRATGFIYTKTAGVWAQSSVDGGANSGGIIARIISPNVPASGPGAYVAANYARARAGRDRVKNKTGWMKVIIPSDSTGAGYLARVTTTGAPGLADARSVSPTNWTAAALDSLALPATANGFFGENNVTAQGSTLPAYNTIVAAFLAGWAVSTFKTAGGFAVENSTNTNALTVAPVGKVTTAEAYFAQDAGLASITATWAGSLGSQTVSAAGTAGILKVLCDAGTSNPDQRFFIARNSGGACRLLGVDFWDSQTPSVRLFNLGWCSGDLPEASGNATAYDALPTTLAIAADLAFVRFGINPWHVGTSVATFKAQLITYVTALLVTTDIILETPFPSKITDTTRALQASYISAIYEVAAQFGLMVNDIWQKIGSWERANSLGYYSDPLHPNMSLGRLIGESQATIIANL